VEENLVKNDISNSIKKPAPKNLDVIKETEEKFKKLASTTPASRDQIYREINNKVNQNARNAQNIIDSLKEK